MQRRPLALSLLLCLPACGDDSDDGSSTSDTEGSTTSDSGATDSGGTTSSSTTGGTTTDASTTSGGSSSGGSTSGVSGTTGDTDGPPPQEPPPATGIEIVDITADQAVRVPIAIDGELVPGGQRNMSLLKDRNTLIRAFYEVDDGFEARDIYALMILKTGGQSYEYGSFQVAHPEPDCVGEAPYDCRYKSLSDSFNFLVEGDKIQPDTTYSITMVEAAPGHEDDVSDKVPIFPTDGGDLIIGVEDSYMKMRVVVVPFDHNVGADCPDPPDLDAPWTGVDGDESAAWFLGNQLIAHNPADEVEIVVHDVENYTGNAQSSGGILNRLQQLRSSDGADPGWYYYGVIRPCEGGPSFSGVAQLGGPEMWEADSRVGWGVYYSNISSTAGTFVHEIGHEQGRLHIECSGGEADGGQVDTSYPDAPEGDLVDEYNNPNYGTDTYSPQLDLHTPTDHDYMTYCGSTWVSEWGYDKVYPWIEEISSWENGDTIPPPEELLHGYELENGTIQWWVGKGWWDPSIASTDHALKYAVGGQIKNSPAVYRKYNRSNEHYIVVPLPKDFHNSGMELTWTNGSSSQPIDRSKIVAQLPLKQP